jgi:hypothetical protein
MGPKSLLATAGQAIFHGHCRSPRGEINMADLQHNRKASLASSVSSTESSSTMRSTHSESCHRHRLHHHDDDHVVVEYDPLSLHPTFRAPARLSERRFIILDPEEEPEYPEEEAQETFFIADDEEDELPFEPEVEHELPPIESLMNNAGHERDPIEDYFLYALQNQRQKLPRSHWSESTIQTLADQSTPQEREVRQTVWPNFSYKRTTVIKRPPMKAMDSVENIIKRGGWKRRGIVFQRESMTATDDSPF